MGWAFTLVVELGQLVQFIAQQYLIIDRSAQIFKTPDTVIQVYPRIDKPPKSSNEQLVCHPIFPGPYLKGIQTSGQSMFHGIGIERSIDLRLMYEPS